jgi:hypothetical protein
MNPHPDAARRFSEIDIAHDTLIDLDSRQSYDYRTAEKAASSQPADPPVGQVERQSMDSPRGVSPSEYARDWSPPPQAQHPRRRWRTQRIDPAKTVLLVASATMFMVAAAIALYVMLPSRIKHDILISILVFLVATVAFVLRMIVWRNL